MSVIFLASCGEASAPAPTTTPIPAAPASAGMPTTEPSVANQPAAEIKLETQTGTSYTLDWGPDGKILAVASGFEISLLGDDLKETIAVLRPENGALGVSWSPNGKQFATVNGLGSYPLNDPGNIRSSFFAFSSQGLLDTIGA